MPVIGIFSAVYLRDIDMGSLIKLTLKYGVAFMVGAGATSQITKDREGNKPPSSNDGYKLAGVALATYYIVKKVF